MRLQQKTLIREQLDSTLSNFSHLLKLQRPIKGWLRAIRDGLGMPAKQFARRLGVAPPRINALEKSEISGSVTIKTMQQAADALDCVFVYAVVPRRSLKDILHKRAQSLAIKRLSRVSHSMLLEEQQLPGVEQQKVLDAEIGELLRKIPKELWEDHDEI